MFATGESSFALFGYHTLLCSEIVFYYLNGVVTYFDHYVSKTSTIALTGSYYLYASSNIGIDCSGEDRATRMAHGDF